MLPNDEPQKLGLMARKYFNHLQQIPGVHPAYFPGASEFLGLALISCGVLTLVISLWQYRFAARYLWGESFAPIARMTKAGMQSPVVAVAVLLIAIGSVRFLHCVVSPHLKLVTFEIGSFTEEGGMKTG